MDGCVMSKKKTIQRLADGALDEMEKRALERGLNKTNVALAVWRRLTREFLLSGSSIKIFVHELFALQPAEVAVNAAGVQRPKSRIEYSLIAIVMAQALIMEMERRAEVVSMEPGAIACAIWDHITERILRHGMPKDQLIGHLSDISDKVEQRDASDEMAN